MKFKNEMCLFDIIIDEVYKDVLLVNLAELKSIHIKSKKVYRKEEASPFKEKVKNLRLHVDNLFNKLGIYEIHFQEIKNLSKEKIKFVVKDSSELINHLSEEINFYTNRFNELERYIATAKIELEKTNILYQTYQTLKDINLSRESLQKLNYFNFEVYTTFSKNLDNLKTLFEFSEVPNVIQTQNISSDRLAFFIIYPKDVESDLKNRLGVIHAEEVPILKKYLKIDGINFERIQNEIDLIESSLTKYETELKRIRNENLLKFAAINEVVYNLEEYSWAESQFEELAFNRLGFKFFAPQAKKEEIKLKLLKNFTQNIRIRIFNIARTGIITEDKEIEKTVQDSILKKERRGETSKKKGEVQESKEDIEETPTLLTHNRIIRPFETLTKMYGVPSYSEIDPTAFLFITFPLLFGIMFGDIGHGLVLVISAIIGSKVFKKRGGDAYNFCWIIFWCGCWSILGGILYGEFFGSEEILGYHLMPVQIPIPFIGTISFYNPINNIIAIFIMTIFIGICHINLGWILQFINFWKNSRKYRSLTESLMKMLFLDGGIILIFVWRFDFNAWFAPPFPPILLPLIPGILLILFKPFGRILGISYMKTKTFGELLGEGSMDTFETVLSVPSNVLSYIRLLALLLAHLSLMLAIRAMIDIIPAQELWYVQVLIIICLIFGNLLVILLEGILVFLNAIRLHFYEFFFKFYEGTGVEFIPFFLREDFATLSFKISTEKDIISKEIEREIETERIKEDIALAKKYITKKFF